ncbi:MAG: hypothetical protein KC413_03500, partial [Anaerolineales bacterium]|nr:hypothetical protein [Anaerolineales bacterium]
GGALFVPAIHFSRFGLRVMLFVPISTLAVTFFWRGIHLGPAARRRAVWGAFGLAGFFVGLGIYSYAAARLFPLLFVLFVPIWLWRERRAWRAYAGPLAGMAGVAGLTALPLLLFFWRYPYYFLFRIAYVANRGKGTVAGRPWLTWLLNVGRVIRGLFWEGELHLRHNLPGRPFLDPVQSIFFLTGTWAALRRKLDLRFVFLWLWLGVMLLPSILSGDAPHFGRLSGAAPALAIFIALGVSHLITWLHPRIHRVLLFSLFSLLCCVSLFFTVRDYFGRYANDPQLAVDFYLPEWELGRYAAAQPAAATLYFTPTQEEMATFYFALADPQRLHSYSGGQGLIPAGEEGETAVYLLRSSAKAALAELQTYFPTGTVQVVNDEFVDAPRLSFWGEAGASGEAGVSAETAISFADAITLRGWSLAADADTLSVTMGWQAAAAMMADYTAFVHVLDAQGNLVAQLDRQPNGYPTHDWRAGEIVVDRYVVPLPAALPPGAYTVETGFYELATLRGLGETAVLTTVTIP